MEIRTKNLYFKDFLPFSYKAIKNKYVLVNEWGDFLILDNEEFKKIEDYSYKQDEKLLNKLYLSNFLAENLDYEKLIPEYKEKNKDLFSGPEEFSVFINNNDTEKDSKEQISKEIIDSIISKIFLTNSENIKIKIKEADFSFNREILDYIFKKISLINKNNKNKAEIIVNFNIETAKKDDFLKLKESNAKAEILFDCIGDDEKEVEKKIIDFYKKAKNIVDLGIEVYSKIVINKNLIKYFKKIVDENVKIGIKELDFNFLKEYERDGQYWDKYGYSDKELYDFYKKYIDYIFNLNYNKKIKDRTISVFLRKILNKEKQDRYFSSPCKGGIKRITFDYRGGIYTCDKAHKLGVYGDELFGIGNIKDMSLIEIAESEAVKSVCIASCNYSLAGCDTCIYKPYCGACPVNNYFSYKDPLKQVYGREGCGFVINILDKIFSLLVEEKNKKIIDKLV
jgi:radical SAM protein with 4Fe4S-binding SPASM domain